MSRSTVGIAIALILASLAVVLPAYALDQPIGAVKLVLKRSPTRETLTFLSRDPAFLFPPPGSGDDPTTGGMVVDLFSASEGIATFAIPAGVGKPGWTFTAGNVPRFRFQNGDAPAGPSSIRLVLLKQGRVLEVTGRITGFSLAGPQGSVGIRIVTGTRRSCALFGAATIKKDEAGRFIAKGAIASSLTDCSDESLGGSPSTTTSTTLPSCQVIPDPFEPMCGGSCPAGEKCAEELGPSVTPGCACIPEDATPCVGSGYPTCGGACSAGRVCQAVHFLPSETPELMLCVCVDPGNTCDDAPGTCFGPGVCPPGEVCAGHGPPTSSCGCSAP
jgi:hypothetical protein